MQLDISKRIGIYAFLLRGKYAIVGCEWGCEWGLRVTVV